MSESMVRQYNHGDRLRYLGTNRIFTSVSVNCWVAIEDTPDDPRFDSDLYDDSTEVMVMEERTYNKGLRLRAFIWYMPLADVEPVE